jgi:hypothetical protein
MRGGDDMDRQAAYDKAKKRAEEKMEFFTHLTTYIVINIILIIINLATSRQYYWFYWPLLGWGIGLVLHGTNVFIYGEGSSLKDRMIQKEMEKQGFKEE